MSRKPIPQRVRKLVYQKYQGHCAYCGCELKIEDMQVDHIVPVYRYDSGRMNRLNNITEEELNSIENYMPACRACNYYKGTWDLEAFRNNLSTMLYRNLKKNFNYKLLLKYGLIKEDIHPVEFYFEKQNDRKG